ncbi:hypothetical protein M440DRAFT_1355392, partial [Trichoderma longibrachiatum ATCC 18648]
MVRSSERTGPADPVRKSRAIDREHGRVGARQHATSQGQGLRPSRHQTSIIRDRPAINWGSGLQCNNHGGTQNVVTGGTLIAGSTFNGEVQFIGEERESRAEILHKLRVWLLGDHTPEERYETSIRKRLNSTCDWMLERPEFTDWLSAAPLLPKLLWINGPPGFGKTVLCARLIQYLKTKHQEPVGYFFSSDLESHKDPVAAMRSWIYHITQAEDSVLDAVHRKWGHGLSASQDVVIELFREAMKSVSNCTLVVDGLDECSPGENRLSLNEFIGELNEAVNGTTTRVLITSRNEPRIHRAILKAKHTTLFQYEVCENDVRSDIDTLSRHIVSEKLSDREESFQIVMIKRMSDQSKGQFLWLRLQEDSLSGGLNQAQLEEAIDRTPADLSCLYGRNWERIQKLPADKRARAMSLLRLAAFSFRPLTVREISEAVLVSDEYKDFPVRELPDKWDENYVQHRILDLGNSLLETRMQNQDAPVGEWAIHLIHFTVKEFLLARIPSQDTVRGNDKLMLAAVHTSLAKLCVTYMKYPQVWQGSDGDNSSRLGSFTDYAARFWHRHTEAGAAEQRRLVDIEDFFHVKNPSWAPWRKWFDSTHDGWGNAQSRAAPPLCYAIELGFVDLATRMIKKGRMRIKCNANNRTALG